jgi:hypothetical protein
VTGAREVARSATRRRVIIWTLFAIYLVPNLLGLFPIWSDPAVGSTASWDLIGWFGFPLVGALILRSRPGNRIGQLMLGVGLWQTLFDALQIPSVTRGLPAGAETVILALQPVVYVTLIVIALMFPGGRLETRLSRVLFWLLAGAFAVTVAAQIVSPEPLAITGRANPFGLDAIAGFTSAVRSYNFIAVPILLVGTAVEVGVRWGRTTDRVVRLQLSWFTFGIVVTAIITALSSGGGGNGDNWVSLAGNLAINAIPAAIFIAITRHGLYEIGRVVSRAVSYIVVTALAVGVYAAAVLLISTFADAASPIVVAISTLAGAAVFFPLLRVVRRVIDRRFDRERYNAQQVVDLFGDRLRSGVDPHSAGADLVSAVGQTLQPSAVGIWTREASR